MKVNLTKRDKNPLLHREELAFEVSDTRTTPSRKDLIAKIAALTNAKPEAVVITKVEAVYGSTGAVGAAKVYESPEFLKAVESGHLTKRGLKEKKEEKKEEAPKPEAKEEKKPEAPAEEKPAEKKAE
jgi:small subunit ribosomal protein S24e